MFFLAFFGTVSPRRFKAKTLVFEKPIENISLKCRTSKGAHNDSFKGQKLQFWDDRGTWFPNQLSSKFSFGPCV